MIKQLYNKKFKVTFIEECDPLKSNDKRGLTYIYFDEEEEPTLMYQECKVWRCDYEQTEIK